MVRLKLDQDILGISSLLERLTGVPVKDCFKEEDTIYIVVPPGNLGRAVGKGGIVIKRIQHQLNKNIRVIEYRDDVAGFVRNVIYPIQVEEVLEEENAVVIRDHNRSVKSQIIGRDGKNLLILKRAVQRFFPSKEVRVE